MLISRKNLIGVVGFLIIIIIIVAYTFTKFKSGQYIKQKAYQNSENDVIFLHSTYVDTEIKIY